MFEIRVREKERFLIVLLSTLTILSIAPAFAQTMHILEGRIEQIFDCDEPQPPEELKATTLKLPAYKPKGPNRLAPALKSFPAIVRGQWSGNLEVVQMDLNQDFFDKLPKEAEAAQDIFTIGRTGEAKFRFYTPAAGTVLMEPPTVHFIIKKGELPGSPPRPAMNVFLPLSAIQNDSRARSNSGECDYSGRLMRNDVRMLSKNTVEQDVLVKSTIKHRQTGKSSVFFSEHVLRFSKVEPFHMKVEVAEVTWSPDGTWWKKMLLKGDVH